MSFESIIERQHKRYADRVGFLQWFHRRGHTRMKPNRRAHHRHRQGIRLELAWVRGHDDFRRLLESLR